MTYPVRGLHYGPALAVQVTLWTQAGSIPGNQLEARMGSVVPLAVLGSFIDIVTGRARGSVADIVHIADASSMATQHWHHFTLSDSDVASSSSRWVGYRASLELAAATLQVCLTEMTKEAGL